MNQQLKRALLTHGYRANTVKGAECELYDIDPDDSVDVLSYIERGLGR